MCAEMQTDEYRDIHFYRDLHQKSITLVEMEEAGEASHEKFIFCMHLVKSTWHFHNNTNFILQSSLHQSDRNFTDLPCMATLDQHHGNEDKSCLPKNNHTVDILDTELKSNLQINSDLRRLQYMLNNITQ